MRIWLPAASAALHAAALVALLAPLPWPAAPGGRVPAPPIEVELIQQPDTQQGGAPAPASPAAPDAAADPDRVPDPQGVPQPASRRAVARPATPAVNLGDAAETRDGADVTGRGVVPAGPDSAFRNQPPAYPIEAARVGAQGTVTLTIRVSARGLPIDVSVSGSSGNASLDRAARNAVRRWRFTPARQDGTAIPYEYPLDIRFILGDQP